MADVAPTILIAGAGPVGSVCALYLAQRNIPVCLVEQAAEPPVDLRASTFHPPTLEMIASLGDGIIDSMLTKGLIVDRYQYRDRISGEVAEFDMNLIGDETEFPYRLQLEQYELTRAIAAKLQEYGCAEHRFSTRLVDYSENQHGIKAELETPQGSEFVQAKYLLGADGASSQVRKAAGIEYDGFTYDEKFLVISTDFPFEEVFQDLSWVNYISDPEEWCVVLRTDKIWRVLFPTSPDDSDEKLLSDAHVEERLQHLYPRNNEKYTTQHRTLYRVHQRVAETYYRGRAILAGDAAHINNPLGGMGMNGGLHDAFNISEKLCEIVLNGASPENMLADYDRQRRTLAVDFVQKHTIENKKLMETKDTRLQQQRQTMLMQTAADKQKAKDFIMERAMFNCLRESLNDTKPAARARI